MSLFCSLISRFQIQPRFHIYFFTFKATSRNKKKIIFFSLFACQMNLLGQFIAATRSLHCIAWPRNKTCKIHTIHPLQLYLLFRWQCLIIFMVRFSLCSCALFVVVCPIRSYYGVFVVIFCCNSTVFVNVFLIFLLDALHHHAQPFIICSARSFLSLSSFFLNICSWMRSLFLAFT